MPADLNALRRRNLLNPYGDEDFDPTAPQTFIPTPQRRIDPTVKIGTSQEDMITSSPINDRLRGLLENAPTQDQYKPSGKRKALGAILGGLTGATRGGEAGAEAAAGIVDAPFRRASEQFQSEVIPLLKLNEIEGLRNKETLANYSELTQRMTARANMDPELRGKIAGSEELAKEGAKAPGKLLERHHEQSMQDQRISNENIRAGNTIRSNEGIAERSQTNQNYRTLLTQAQNQIDEEGRNARNAADIKSREKIAANSERNKREIAELNRKSGKASRIPIDQQVKAREEAEYRILRDLGQQELEAISDPLYGSGADKNTIVGRILKPLGSIKDPRWRGRWEMRRDDAAEMAQKMLEERFNPDGSEVGATDEEEDLGPWEYMAQ